MWKKQAAALSTGLGLAGNTDLDIVRNPLLSKGPYLVRGMIHKVFALSKDKIENQRSFLSLFDELPRRRLELRFGKFSMPDFLDQNSVGSDTHLQFRNWTVDNNGAWDYAADTRGYAVGATVDYEDRNWGFRFAEGLEEGGLGFLLGDGRLDYGRENIVETYYTAHVWRGIYVAPDLQHIENPGYNRDRGPVLVPSFRLHVEF
jgi:carbohydrate-selective porin (OprB family)